MSICPIIGVDHEQGFASYVLIHNIKFLMSFKIHGNIISVSIQILQLWICHNLLTDHISVSCITVLVTRIIRQWSLVDASC